MKPEDEDVDMQQSPIKTDEDAWAKELFSSSRSNGQETVSSRNEETRMPDNHGPPQSVVLDHSSQAQSTSLTHPNPSYALSKPASSLDNPAVYRSPNCTRSGLHCNWIPLSYIRSSVMKPPPLSVPNIYVSGIDPSLLHWNKSHISHATCRRQGTAKERPLRDTLQESASLQFMLQNFQAS
jgi:hypothetical protein